MKLGNHLPTWLGGTTPTTTAETTAGTAGGVSVRAPYTPATLTTATPPSETEARASEASAHHSMRAKLTQFFSPGKLFNPPALQLEGPWGEVDPSGKGKAKETDAIPVPEQISALWLGSLKQGAREEVSVLALSRLKALEYERKNLATIPKDRRILPDAEDGYLGKVTSLAQPVLPDAFIEHRNRKGHKKTYHDEVVRTLLEAVGEKDIEAVLESFKEAGTGGLHRHGVAMLTAAANMVNAAQQLDPEPISKAVLVGVRLALILASGERAFASWDARVGNAQTEELMVAGRADAPPSAKVGPDILRGSWDLMTEAWTTKKTIKALDTARQRVALARTAHATSNTPATANELRIAERKLRQLHAKECYQIAVKSRYKTASESSKVELIGNKRYIQMSLSGTALTSGAGLFAILAPILGGFVTGGISAGAAVAALSLYLAYHFSSMPSDDGVRKALRAIIALAKSSDVFSDERIGFDVLRVQAHEEYLEQRKKARWIGDPAKRKAAREQAKQLLDDRLLAIEQAEGDAQPAVTPQQNWENYRKHLQKTAGLPPEEKIKADKAYEAAHQAEFQSDVVAAAWKDPIGMRIDTGRKLLSGKIAQAHKRLLKLEKASTVKDFLHLGMKPQEKTAKKNELVTELQQVLADLLNLEAAEKAVKQAAALPLAATNGASGSASPQADAEAQLAAALMPANRFLAAIQDEEFRALFCGDTDAQVAASKKAKLLTVGEGERYKWTNFGSTAVVVGISASVVAADFGIAVAKALPPDVPPAGPDGTPPPQSATPPQGQYHGPKFADYKFLATQSMGASLNGHYNAGSRAKIRDVDMKELLKTVEKAVDDFTDTLPWPKSGTFTGTTATNVVAELVEGEEQDATMGAQLFDDDDMTGLLADFVKREAGTDAPQAESFGDELKNLLVKLAREDGFAAGLDMPEGGTFSAAELKRRVAELLKKESFATILDMPEVKTLTVEQIKDRAAELLEKKTSFNAEVDVPTDGAFGADQMAGLVTKLLAGTSLPKKLRISLADPTAAPDAATTSAADFNINLEKTVPFQRLQYLESGFGDKLRYRRKEAAIVGKQIALALFGIPAHLMAQLALARGASLDRMKEARNAGADMLKGTDEETNAMRQWLEELSEVPTSARQTNQDAVTKPASSSAEGSGTKAGETSGTNAPIEERPRRSASLRAPSPDREAETPPLPLVENKDAVPLVPLRHSRSASPASPINRTTPAQPATRRVGLQPTVEEVEDEEFIARPRRHANPATAELLMPLGEEVDTLLPVAENKHAAPVPRTRHASLRPTVEEVEDEEFIARPRGANPTMDELLVPLAEEVGNVRENKPNQG